MTNWQYPPKESKIPPVVIERDGSETRADNYPGYRKWAMETRAGLIQQKKALQEQIRGLGIQIAALESMLEDLETGN